MFGYRPPVEEERWEDYFGNWIDVATPPSFFVPFSIWEDPWCDLSFLSWILDDVKAPTYEEWVESGLDYNAMVMKELEREEAEEKIEERIRRKAWLLANPDVIVHRQKKKSRTMRRRRLAQERKEQRRYDAQYTKKEKFEIFVTEDYDDNMLVCAVPSGWIVMFWLISFKDDNKDYKLFIVDKSKEVFWPAEPISKRALGYELLEFMPTKPLKRSGSLHNLERERTWLVEMSRDDVFQLRRSKSENNLNAECSQLNRMKNEELETFEKELDLYIQLVECERQDECDQDGLDFCYTY